jgi:hypothetical protein
LSADTITSYESAETTPVQLKVTAVVDGSDVSLAGAVMLALPVGQLRTVKVKVELLRVESCELQDG